MRVQKKHDKPVLSPKMIELLDELTAIMANKRVEAKYDEAIASVQPVIDGKPNVWCKSSKESFVQYFRCWFLFLPHPDDGLGFIVPFTHFYRDNPTAIEFLNSFKSSKVKNREETTEIFNWTLAFIKERGEFMDSEESLFGIQDWTKNPDTKIDDFVVPPRGFRSFNDFFTRSLKSPSKSRPISDPKDSSIVVAPADSEINWIQSQLTLNTPLSVKTRYLNISELLAGSKHAQKFVGGTAISCVLMPNNYHRFHSPVDGNVVESQEVKGMYFGITDGQHWFNKGNIGEGTTDFSVFEDFHRAYYVIDTVNHGYVAMIAVGLNTISSIHSSLVSDKEVIGATGEQPVLVQKGKELGYFAYGGSLNILLFQEGTLKSLSVLLGQRIGRMQKIHVNEGT